jgi:hypothetical protein
VVLSNESDKFYRLIGELDHLLVKGAGDRFWSARPIFAEMDRSFLNGWVTCRLKELQDHRDFLVFRDRNSLTINVTKAYAISLATIDEPPTNLFLYPQHYIARNVGRAPLKVRRYRCDRPIRNDVYDPDVRLVPRDEFELLPDEVLERDGHGDVVDWQSDGATGYLLRLHSESLGQYEWAFDRTTLAPKGVTVLDASSSQVATAMQMLTALDVPVDRDFIEAGLGSPDFHVRWETLKMVNRVAPELVRETLERLTADPHPAIRRAAEKTLSLNATKQTMDG